MDLETAERNIRNGIRAGAVMAVLCTVLTSIAILFSDQESIKALKHWNDPWNFLDPVFIAFLLFGLHKKSRVAATVLFVGCILGQLMYMKETGTYRSIVVSLIFLLFFGKAIQGTFFYHRFERANNPDYKRPNKLVWTLIGIPGGILSILVGIVMLVTFGVLPDSKALRSAEINERTMRTLRSNKLITPTERVLYFYSGGLFSFLADGNLFTDSRVVSYETVKGGVLDVYSARYDEIEDIQARFSQSAFEDTEITITRQDGDEFVLLVSAEDGRDKEFADLLKSEWRKHRPNRPGKE